MKCLKCTYQWVPRKNNPKECPRCKTRLDYRAVVSRQVQKQPVELAVEGY